MKRAFSGTRAVGLMSLATLAIAFPIVACSSDGSRTPFTTAATSTGTTEPNPSSTSTSPPETASTTQQESPSKPTGDGGPVTPVDPGCTKAAPSNVCGVAPQCGCGPTQTCDVTDTQGSSECVSAGKAPMGSPCTATSGCAVGLTCIGGTCHAFCNNPGSACTAPGTGVCEQIKQAGNAIPNLAICRVACAPQDPMSCGGTTLAGTGVCMVDDQGGTDCQAGGTLGENAKCSPTDDCGPALVCVTTTQGSTSTSSCKKWCRVGQNDCGAGKTCAGFKTAVKVGAVEYGACP